MKNETLSMMQLFHIPCMKVEVGNWSNKKNLIIDLIESEGDLHRENNFATNYMLANNATFNAYDKKEDRANSYSQPVWEILKNDVEPLVEAIGAPFMPDCPFIWSQKYWKGGRHDIHNHGNRGFSFVLYLKFNELVHGGTVFYAPFFDYMSGGMIDYQPEVKEGDLICFPSSLQHASPVQETDEERMILSFNLFEDGPYL